jgi:hypothetical protein
MKLITTALIALGINEFVSGYLHIEEVLGNGDYLWGYVNDVNSVLIALILCHYDLMRSKGCPRAFWHLLRGNLFLSIATVHTIRMFTRGLAC